MTPQEKYKEIACAFARYLDFFIHPPEEEYNAWLLTEEGKRLTAEEPMQEEGKIGTPAFDYYYPASSHKTEDEEVKWLRHTVAMATDTAQALKDMKQQLDRIEGRLKGNLFAE